MIRLGEPLDRVTVECFGANGPKAVEHERGIYRNCWYFTSMGPSQDYFEKKIAMSPMRTAVSRERKAVVESAGGIYFGI